MAVSDDTYGEIHTRRPLINKGTDMARSRKNSLPGESETDMADETQPDAPAESTAELSVDPQGHHVTYLPGPEDPPKVTWGGHTFFANVPKFIENPELIEKAIGNRFFHVGEFDAAKAVELSEQPTQPQTPDQYRAHAIEWVKRMQSVDELDRKWAAEEVLRIECGVGADDIEYLGSIITPIRSELRKRDMAR